MAYEGFLPDYKYDLCISYTHLDNAQEDSGVSGWVDTFHKFFKYYLEKKHLNAQVNILRHLKTHKDDYVDPQYIDQVQNSALFITIVSPNYLSSKWCQRELEAFVEKANQTTGLKIDHASRIVKVAKLPVLRTDLNRAPLNILDTMLGYDFYTVQHISGIAQSFPEFDPIYFGEIERVAEDTAKLLKAMKHSSNG